MTLWKAFTRLLASAALSLSAAAASAGPVTLTLQGTITGYEFMDLSGIGLTTGTSVSLSLTFNETWSDGTYSFADPLGPVSGSMTVGSYAYTFDGGRPYSYHYSLPSGDIEWVNPFFTGTGPSLGGGDFFGLYAATTPAMQLFDKVYLGYGFTTTYEGGVSVTSYGYAAITADSYTITPGGPNPVPAPATLSLAMVGLLAAGFARRRN